MLSFLMAQFYLNWNYANKFSGHEIYLLLIDDSKFYMKQKVPGVLFLPYIIFIVGLDLFQTSVIDT